MVRSNLFTGQNLRVFEAAFVYPVPNKHIAHGDKSLHPFSIHFFQQSGHRNFFFLRLLSKATNCVGLPTAQTNEASFMCVTMCLIYRTLVTVAVRKLVRFMYILAHTGYMRVSKIFRTEAVKIIKLTIRLIDIKMKVLRSQHN
jgi:hypothetical protein